MVFKSLELSGFKSFADKTTLLFEPGVTAIVGPNGSGKSNLSDAIKWVLGEQSARELRGGHMEDLIFNGTDSRPPLNVADVTLTFDNASKRLPTEYHEVAITRRLYRSGESEYLLNKTAVRLKDITELLMGTGIGTSAYSLFEQGKIDQLIHAHPEERRAIFEEAAGITKFKTQKREALRKLEQTEANLLRLTDVVGEVRRQLAALERQVKKAQAYRTQWERLKDLEVTLAQREHHRLQAERRQREGQHQMIRAEEQRFLQEQQAAESALAARRAELERVDRSYAEANAEALRLAHAVEMAARQIQTHQERLAEGRSRAAQAAHEMEALRLQGTQTMAQAESLRAAVAATEAERQGYADALTQAQSGLDAAEASIQQAQAVVREQKGAVVEAAVQASRWRNELMTQASQRHAVEARLQRLEVEDARVLQEGDAATGVAADLEAALAAGRAAATHWLTTQASRQAALAEAQARAEALERAIHEQQQAVVALESRHEVIQGLVASGEGLSPGVKALLEAVQRGAVPGEGIFGVLAHLLHAEPGYEAAVEAALGDWAQAIVVDTWETAARCVTHLQETGAGRATVLVCQPVPGRAAGQSRPAEATGPYERLLSRVRTEPATRGLVETLLERTYVVPDLRGAVEQQRAAIAPMRCVTQQGERVTATSVSGGRLMTADHALVGRQQRLAQLAAEVEAARGQVRAARAAAEEAAAAARGLQTELADETQRSQATRSELAQREAALAAARTTLQKVIEEHALLETELGAGREQLAERQAQEQALQRTLEEAAAREAQHQQAIAAAQQQIEQASQDRERQVHAAAQARAQLASVDQVRAGREQSLTLLMQAGEGIRQTLAARQAEVEALAQRETELTARCAALDQEIAAHCQQQAAGAQALQAVAAQRAAVAETIARQQQQVHAQTEALEAVRRQLHEHDLATAQTAYQQESVVTRLAQVYQVTFEPSAEPPAEQDWDRLAADCEGLRRKLEGIGPVSLATLDESKELEERLAFLTSQQTDLQKAKDDLHEAITTINRTTRAQFKETFHKIQQEFQTTFRTLFGGGEARLVLLDEEDLLESGIEIIARPPGKTPQSISLLSGGEKALTSVALLFAIFRVKPSPFCLLDEIDAPLDEANVDRFTRALKEFLKDSQFIIITHNKKTIVMADVMYGVTMEEQGVSRLVSVKLQDRAAEPAAPAAPTASD